MAGMLYAISGPSGAGKSTVIHQVMKDVPNLGYSVSHTTRRPRAEEVDGRDYHFVDKETFLRMIREGDFLEWAEVYDDLYGTSLSGLHRRLAAGMDVILDVDVQGAGNVRRRFEDSVLIFLLPPTLEVLEKRLRDRGTESEKAFRNRTEKALREIRESRDYDYIVFNDELRDGVKRVASIILAERCRSRLQFPVAAEIFRVT
jgi:guanylate kinase